MKKHRLAAVCAVVTAGTFTLSVSAGASEEKVSKTETSGGEETSKEEISEKETDKEQTSGEKDETESSGKETSEGKILNVFSWNEEFKIRMEEYYPGYEAVDDTTGTIGEVTVKWVIVPESSADYQKELDQALLNQASASEEEKIDLFLVEEEYARKYVETDYAMDLADLGITEENTAGQFSFTKEYVTDADGRQKGSAWYACPGVLIYNREIAGEVLGTDEPSKVQESVKDWDTFLETVEAMKEAGYSMTSSVYDTYRIFAENADGSGNAGDGITAEEHLKEWEEMSKIMADNQETGTFEMWSEDWSKGFYPDGGVFCYFGPSWFYEYDMDSDVEGSVAAQGGWAVTEGPESFFWGGTWLCAAEGTDNPELVKNIMLKMTCNKEVLNGIAASSGDFVNHINVMKNYAEDERFDNAVLGGQNPVTQILNCAKSLKLGNTSGYGVISAEEFLDEIKERPQ